MDHQISELSNAAYSTYKLLRHFTPLLRGREKDATDATIQAVCSEIVAYLGDDY